MKKKISIAAVISILTLTASAQTYEQYVEAGNRLAQHDSLTQAEEQYRNALRLAPEDYRNALIYANLAKVQLAQGQSQKALNSYELALGIVPRNVPILKSRADLYLKLGNLTKALIDYRNILEVDPNNTEALQYLGYIYTKQREYAKAKTHYERLLSIEPDTIQLSSEWQSSFRNVVNQVRQCHASRYLLTNILTVQRYTV